MQSSSTPYTLRSVLYILPLRPLRIPLIHSAVGGVGVAAELWGVEDAVSIVAEGLVTLSISFVEGWLDGSPLLGREGAKIRVFDLLVVGQVGDAIDQL